MKNKKYLKINKIIMNIKNKYLPINTFMLIKELKRKGISDNIIENINWNDFIQEDYCNYLNYNGKLCLLRKEDKKLKFCSTHNNIKNELSKYELKIIEEKIKDMKINNNSTKNHKSCFYLNEDNIEKLYTKTNELINVLKKYKKGDIDFNILCNVIIDFNNIIYESENEPYISISYFLQMLEEIYEISNEFFDKLLYNDDIYNDHDKFLETCKKWKKRLQETIHEINLLPDYYKEYYILINKKIEKHLFKSMFN